MTGLGLFFLRHNISKADIYYKTNISESKLSVMSNDPDSLLYADEFYLIAKGTGKDFDQVASEVFENIKIKNPQKISTKALSKLGDYVTLFLNSKKDFAQSLDIEQARFSKLINDPNKRPYAKEVYAIAKFTKKKPSELFEEWFGHLKLNSTQEIARLKKLKSTK